MRVSIVPKDIFLFVGVGLICRAFNWPRARSSSVMVHGSGVHPTEAGSLLPSHFYNRTESDIQWLPPAHCDKCRRRNNSILHRGKLISIALSFRNVAMVTPDVPLIS